MHRRKVLWYPTKGIDNTKQLAGNDFIDYCWDATNVAVYDDGIVRSRAEPTGFGLSIPVAAEIIQAIQVASVSGDPPTYTYILTTAGLYRDDELVWEYAIPTAARMIVWEDTIIIGLGETAGDTMVITDPQDGSLGSAQGLGSIPALPSDLWPTVDTPVLNDGHTYLFIYDSVAHQVTLGGDPVSPIAVNDKIVVVYSAPPFDTPYTWYVGRVEGIISTRCFGIADWEDYHEPPTFSDYHLGVLYVGTVQTMTLQEITNYANSRHDYWAQPEYDVYYKVQYLTLATGVKSNSVTTSNTAHFKFPVASPKIVRIPVVWSDASYPADFDTLKIFRYDPRVTTVQTYRLVHQEDIAAMLPYVDAVDGNTYVDWVDDYTLIDGTEEMWIEDRNYPPVDPDGHVIGFRFVMLYANRLWGIWRNRVYYSEAADTSASFNYFGPTGLNYFEFVDRPVCLLDGVTSMYVVCTSSIWVLGGTNPSAMTQRRILDHVGAYNIDAIAYHSGNLYGLSRDGKLSVVFGRSYEWIDKINSLLETYPSTDLQVVLAAIGDIFWISLREETLPLPGETTEYFAPKESSDDGSGYDSSHFWLEHNGIMIGYDLVTLSPWSNFVRFKDVAVLRGTQITGAYLRLMGWINSGGTCNVTIYLHAVDDSIAPTTYEELMALPLTTGVPWEITDYWGGYGLHDSVDISVAVQEIINRSGWRSGNSITAVMHNDIGNISRRQFCSYDVHAQMPEERDEPKLYIVI